MKFDENRTQYFLNISLFYIFLIKSIRDEDHDKKRIAKGRIIDELIQTEMDYYKVMKLLYDVYLGVNSEKTVSNILCFRFKN